MGWSRDEKKDELKDPASRVVLLYREPAAADATTMDGVPGQAPRAQDRRTPLPGADRDPRDLVAFLAIRFELEDLDDADSAPVLYWCVLLLPPGRSLAA